MTIDEFWFAFQSKEYAVRCDTRWEHDHFVRSYEKFCGERQQHKHSPPFLYLCCLGPRTIGGWTGRTGISQGPALKITFQDWLAMQEEPEDDISVSNLEEVL